MSKSKFLLDDSRITWHWETCGRTHVNKMCVWYKCETLYLHGDKVSYLWLFAFSKWYVVNVKIVTVLGPWRFRSTYNLSHKGHKGQLVLWNTWIPSYKSSLLEPVSYHDLYCVFIGAYIGVTWLRGEVDSVPEEHYRLPTLSTT